jgi:hypothetical protein
MSHVISRNFDDLSIFVKAQGPLFAVFLDKPMYGAHRNVPLGRISKL